MMRALVAVLCLLAGPAFAQTRTGPGFTASTPYIATGASAPAASNDRAARQYYLQDFSGAACDWNGSTGTDNATVLTAAMTAVSNAGGGKLIPPATGQCYFATSITVPANVVLGSTGSPAGSYTSDNFSSAPATLVHPTTATLNVGARGRIENLIIKSSALVTATSLRTTFLTMLPAWAGTGVTFTGADAQAYHIQILGFNRGLDSQHERPLVEDYKADNNKCLSIENGTDVVRFRDMHCWPFTTAGQSWTVGNWAISAIANNGSGAVRLTVATMPFTAGDVIAPAISGTAQSVLNTRWQATVVDTTHLDLIGSTFTATAGAAGQAYLSADRRPGPCIEITDASLGTSNSVIDSGLCFGYDVGVHLGNNSAGNTFSNFGIDNNGAAQDPTTIGVNIDGTAYGTSWFQGYINGMGQSIVANSSSPAGLPNRFTGTILSTNAGTTVTANGGKLYLTGVQITGTGAIQVNDTVGQASFTDIWAPNITLNCQDAAAQALITQDGANTFGSGSCVTGSPQFYSATLGVDQGQTIALIVQGSSAADNSQGAEINFKNTTAGNPAPNSYLRKSSAGNMQLLNNAAALVALWKEDGSFWEGSSNTQNGTKTGVLGNSANDNTWTDVICHGYASTNSEMCEFSYWGTTAGSSTIQLTTDGTGTVAGANCLTLPLSISVAVAGDYNAIDVTTPANSFVAMSVRGQLSRGASGNVAYNEVSAGTTAFTGTGNTLGAGTARTADTTHQCLNVGFQAPSGNTDTWRVNYTGHMVIQK